MGQAVKGRMIAVVGLVGALAAGCSSSPPAPVTSQVASTSAAPTPTPTDLGEVGNVVELKDAAIAAGYFCANWQQTNVVVPAAESGTCSDADVFSTYISQEKRDQVVSFLKESPLDVSLLVGPNWIINGQDAPALQAKLGGIVVGGSGS